MAPRGSRGSLGDGTVYCVHRNHGASGHIRTHRLDHKEKAKALRLNLRNKVKTHA